MGLPNLEIITRLTAPNARMNTIEPFVDEKTGETNGLLASLGIVSFLGIFIVAFIASFGAARLSWCYNMSLGNSTGLSIFYAVLAYIFSGFYYPYYAFFLNPVCNMRSPVAAVGGRRR